MLSRGAVHDPGIGFITLPRVQVTSDLQQARVFYTTLGDEKARRETERALTRATPYLRRQVGSRLRLRRVPELEFRFDESIGHQDRIEQVLRELHDADAERSPEETGTAASPDASHDPAATSSPASSTAGDAHAASDDDAPRTTPHDDDHD